MSKRNAASAAQASKMTFQQVHEMLSLPTADPAEVRIFNVFARRAAQEDFRTFEPIRIKSKGRDRSRRRRAQELAARQG